jgi:hypothetical protein
MTKSKDSDRTAMFKEGKEYTDIIRFPLKLFVDGIEFGPSASIDVVRTAYELDLTPYEMKKLYDWLGIKLEKEPYSPQKIVVIGRLSS